MMQRILASAIVATLALGSMPQPQATRDPGRVARSTGSIAGAAVTEARTPIAGATVRLRHLQIGRVISTVMTTSTGAFSFGRLDPGAYVIEIVTPAGTLLGARALNLTPENMVVTGVTITALTSGLPAVQATAGPAGFFGSTLGIVTMAAIAAGVTIGVVAAQQDASPNR